MPACQTKSYSESSYRKWRERERLEREKGGWREKREERVHVVSVVTSSLAKDFFECACVCLLKLGLIESESNCSLSHSLSLSSYLAFAHAVLALSLERALFLC